MKLHRFTTDIILGGFLAAVVSSAAFAQVQRETNIPAAPAPVPPVGPGVPAPTGPLERGMRVTERPRPEYDARGVRLGTFFLYPRVEIDELYNDNVFATSSGRKDDWITVVSPTIELRSNWSTHLLDVRTGLSKGWYLDNSSEDYLDYFGAIDGRFDVDRNHALLGGVKYERLHEERESPDTAVGAAEPVEFNVYSANIGAAQRGLRIGYEALFDVRREEYETVPSIAGGFIPQSIRNLNTYTPSLRFSYEIAPRYEAFVRGSVNWRDYDHTTPLGAGVAPLDRNSWGYRIDAGATIDITGVTFAEVFLGYLSQDYDDSRFATVDGVDFGARVVWNATQLTSVVFNASRRVQDANSFSATGSSSPGYLRSDVGVSVDHELFRNLLLNGRVNYQNDDYEGLDRTDNRFDVGAGLRYLVTQNVYLGGSYTYTRRSSDGAAATGEFSRNLFLLRLGLQL